MRNLRKKVMRLYRSTRPLSNVSLGLRYRNSIEHEGHAQKQPEIRYFLQVRGAHSR